MAVKVPTAADLIAQKKTGVVQAAQNNILLPAKPPAPKPTSAPATTSFFAPVQSRTQTKQVYTPSTGQTVSTPVPVAAPTPVTPAGPVSSYEDIGKANIQNEFDKTAKAGLDLGLDSGSTFGSITEMYKAKIDQQRRDKASQQSNLDQSKIDNKQNADRAVAQEKSNATSTAVTLGPNREGFMSQSNAADVNQVKDAASMQIARISQKRDTVQSEIDRAQQNLDAATKSGNTELAQQYKQTLDSATSRAEQVETEFVNAQRAANNDKLNTVKSLIDSGVIIGASPAQLAEIGATYGIDTTTLQLAANSAARSRGSSAAQQEFENQTKALGTFKELAGSGVQITLQMAKTFASQTGLPLDTILSFNETAQAVMADKNLDNSQKMQTIAQKGYELDQMKQGIFNKDQQNYSFLENLYKQGASQEMISAYKSAAGIKDPDDPMYQADLAYKNAQATIEERHSRGEAVTPQDMAQLADAQSKMAELNADSYNGAPSADTLINAAKSYMQSGDWKDDFKKISVLQNGNLGCAWVATSILTKAGLLDKPIASIQETVPELEKKGWTRVGTPAPGDVVVWGPMQGTDGHGHIGIVTDNNKAVNNQGPTGPAETPIYTGRTVEPTKNYPYAGFYRPPAGDKFQKAAMEIMKPGSLATLTSYSTKEREKIIPYLNQLKETARLNGDTLGYIRASAGGKQLESTTVEGLSKAQNVLDQLSGLESTISSMDTGPIVGAFRSANPYDVDAAKLKAQLQAIVPNLARGIYGEVGVLTDSDIQNYIQTLPNAKSPDDQKKALMDLTKRTIRSSINNKLTTYANAGYDVSGFAPLIESLQSPDSKPNQQDNNWNRGTKGIFTEAYHKNVQMITDHFEQTGQYTAPEKHPINNHDF